MAYIGSKAQDGTFHRIIGQMPAHSVYVEPFFGSGEIFWRKLPAARSVIIDKRSDLIAAALARSGATAGLSAIAGDAISLLPGLSLLLPPDAVVYCDPPYLLSTRKGRRYYEHEMSDEDHAALLKALLQLNCRVMISGYPSELYRSSLLNWRCLSYKVRTRGSTKTECLWMNFAPRGGAMSRFRRWWTSSCSHVAGDNSRRCVPATPRKSVPFITINGL